MRMSTSANKHETKWWHFAIILPLFPLLLVVAIFALVLFVVASISLRIVIWAW